MKRPTDFHDLTRTEWRPEPNSLPWLQLQAANNLLFYGEPEKPQHGDLEGRITPWRSVVIVGSCFVEHPVTGEPTPQAYAAFNGQRDKPEATRALVVRLRQVLGDLERSSGSARLEPPPPSGPSDEPDPFAESREEIRIAREQREERAERFAHRKPTQEQLDALRRAVSQHVASMAEAEAIVFQDVPVLIDEVERLRSELGSKTTALRMAVDQVAQSKGAPPHPLRKAALILGFSELWEAAAAVAALPCLDDPQPWPLTELRRVVLAFEDIARIFRGVAAPLRGVLAEHGVDEVRREADPHTLHAAAREAVHAWEDWTSHGAAGGVDPDRLPRALSNLSTALVPGEVEKVFARNVNLLPQKTPAEAKALGALHRWLHSPAGDSELIDDAQDYHTQVGGEAGDAPICQQLELEEREATRDLFGSSEMGLSPLVQAAIRELQKTGRYGVTLGETMAHVLKAGLLTLGERESGGARKA